MSHSPINGSSRRGRSKTNAHRRTEAAGNDVMVMDHERGEERDDVTRVLSRSHFLQCDVVFFLEGLLRFTKDAVRDYLLLTLTTCTSINQDLH